MTSAQLAELCKQLHISGVYTYICESAAANDEMESFMRAALQAELDVRMLNRQMKILREAGFPTKKRFEDLVSDALPEDGRKAVSELKSLGFVQDKRNVILLGNSGTGKTHLAIAAGVLACEHNYRVMFRTTAGLVNEMTEARQDNRLSMLMRQFKKVDLLILDELGYVTFDLAAAELVFQLLAARYETSSTIITSNLSFSDWIKVFHDKSLTAAILDRITHRSAIFNMNGVSFRRR
jgi:DNA replication protein DnaC